MRTFAATNAVRVLCAGLLLAVAPLFLLEAARADPAGSLLENTFGVVVLVDAATRAGGDHGIDRHCHPGFDCWLAAIFVPTPSLRENRFGAKQRLRTAPVERSGLIVSVTLPPPRNRATQHPLSRQRSQA